MRAHAGMQQRARLKALDRFKANENAVLVASDVAARGLDVTVSPLSSSNPNTVNPAIFSVKETCPVGHASAHRD